MKQADSMVKEPLKICNWPGCFKLTQERHCIEHTEAHRIRRRKANNLTVADPFYSSSVWRKLKRAKQRANPLCEPCEARGIVTPMIDVHHKLPRATHPELELDFDNLESTCRTCHRAHTLREIRERKRDGGYRQCRGKRLPTK
jgi:5-methylcytosine-specific restriction protein A